MSELTIEIKEFKARPDVYIRQASAGRTVIVTERGRPILRLTSVTPSAYARARELRESEFPTL